ncbi:hypothetical protein PDE01_21800 [Paracoccus denitrificans]|nr:hypothetical protein PDE01_21800 [Paracoccus denitrificans]
MAAQRQEPTVPLAGIPKPDRMRVPDLARCEWIEGRENAIALGSCHGVDSEAAAGKIRTPSV